MQKQSNITSVQDLPAEKLFQMAEEKNEEMNDEEAEYYYSLAYKKSPENDMIVLCYSEFLKSNDNVELSKDILLKSIKQRPQGTYKRYFQLAELYHGQQAIKIFEEGIKKAKQINPTSLNLFSSQKISTKDISRDIANAYAAIAEVCMSDLIDYKQAEGKCIQSLQLGQQIDPQCLDVKLQQANYLLFKDKEEQAKLKLLGIHKHLTNQPEDYSDQLKQQTAKLLIEVESFREAIDILDNLNQATGKDLDIVYLLAFSYFQLKLYSRCTDFLQQCQQLVKESQDQQIIEATMQLRKQVDKLDPKLLQQQEPQQTVEDDGDEDWMDVEQM